MYRREARGMHRREAGLGGVIQAVKHLLSTHEGLSSGPQNPYIMQLYPEHLKLGTETGGSGNLQTSTLVVLVKRVALTMAALIKKRFHWGDSAHQ